MEFLKQRSSKLLAGTYSLARTCLFPWPHYSAWPKRFGSRGPSENVRPRQKFSQVRQKWDSSMAMVNKTSVLHFKVKNTLLKHTDGKGNFKRMLRFFSSWQRKAFSYKIVLQGIQNTRNFHHSRWERLACFETPPSNEVFEEFSGTFCTLWSRKWHICEYFILDINFYTFWDRLEQPIWDLCWIIFAMCSADLTFVNGSTSQICVTRIVLRINLYGPLNKKFFEK